MTQELFPVAILAGGLGTRLHPITEVIPKSLIAINGEPFIAHQLALLKKGIKKVVLCLGHLNEKIIEYIDSQHCFDIKILYSFDGESLLGTAGALKKALPLLGENFFVLYGDAYLDCDYLAVQNEFLQKKKLGLMTVYQNNDKWDVSNVEYHHPDIIAYDKHHKTDRMKHIDYGLSIFNQGALQQVKVDQFVDLTKLYQALLKKNQLTAYEIMNRFYEIGSQKGIAELSMLLTWISE